jgi:hypothetical protein
MAVAVADPLAQLAHEFLDHGVTESEATEVWTRTLGECLAAPTVADGEGLHVLFQIEVEELEDEVEFVPVSVHDVEQTHNVGVVHFFEKGDLADSGGWYALIFGLEADLLESYYAAAMEEIAGFVDDSIGS